jgi:hypothetical protein
MDTTQPPTKCEQCGEFIADVEPWMAVASTDKDTGELIGFPAKVIHEACWPAWAGAHGIK